MGASYGKCCAAEDKHKQAIHDCAGEALAEMIPDSMSSPAVESLQFPKLTRQSIATQEHTANDSKSNLNELPKNVGEAGGDEWTSLQQKQQAVQEQILQADQRIESLQSQLLGVQKTGSGKGDGVAQKEVLVLGPKRDSHRTQMETSASTIAPADEDKNTMDSSFQSAIAPSEADTMNSSFTSNASATSQSRTDGKKTRRKEVKGGTKKNATSAGGAEKKSNHVGEEKKGDMVEGKTHDKEERTGKTAGQPLIDYKGADSKETIRTREKAWKKLNQAEKFDKAAQLLTCAKEGKLNEALDSIVDGVSPNCADRKGYTPLMQAAENDRADIITLLLDLGADSSETVRIGDWGRNALHIAASADRLEAAKILLERGNKTDAQAKDMYGKTPRDYSHTREMKKLLKKHA